MENSDFESGEEFEEKIVEAQPRIVAVGCGGAGCNTISRLMEEEVDGIETITVNTDAQDLLHANSDSKILIGKELTGGLGAGSDPDVGMRATREDLNSIKDKLYEAEMVFVTCGLGGGTGTGAGPVVAEVAKGMDALTVGVLTVPFEAEGQRRMKNAEKGLEKFLGNLDSVILIRDERLLEIAPDLSIVQAFRLADTVLSDLIRGLTDLITKPGLINLDFADIESVLREGGPTLVGFGESESNDRAVDASEEAIGNPLLEIDISRVDEALVNITGCSDMSLEEAQRATEVISGSLAPEADLIWGAQIDDYLQDLVKVMIIVPGAELPDIRGKKLQESTRAEDALGDLEYVA